jgi:hypothetical protein
MMRAMKNRIMTATKQVAKLRDGSDPLYCSLIDYLEGNTDGEDDYAVEVLGLELMTSEEIQELVRSTTEKPSTAKRQRELLLGDEY